eukprot:3408922-Pyramimonas_sp.AAC.1
MAADKVIKTDAEWKEQFGGSVCGGLVTPGHDHTQLSAKEFEVLRKKGTEPARSGEYDKMYPKEGYFACKGCGNPLVRLSFERHRRFATGVQITVPHISTWYQRVVNCAVLFREKGGVL